MNTQRNARGQFTKAYVSQTIDDAHVHEERADSEAYAKFYSRMFGELQYKHPWLGLITGMATAYLGGYVGGVVTNVIAASAVAFTGWAWLGFVVTLFGIVLSIIAGYIIGSRVTGYVATGGVERDIGRAREWLGSKFTELKGRVAA